MSGPTTTCSLSLSYQVCVFSFVLLMLELTFTPRVAGGLMVRALHSQLNRSQVRLPAVSLSGRLTTLGKLFARMYCSHQAV